MVWRAALEGCALGKHCGIDLRAGWGGAKKEEISTRGTVACVDKPGVITNIFSERQTVGARRMCGPPKRLYRQSVRAECCLSSVWI